MGTIIASFVVGVVLGFVGSIPAAGPLALLVVTSAIENDRRRALLLACGGATAEASYALLAFGGAFWGVAALVPRHPVVVPAAHAIGAVLLVAVGVALLMRRVGARETGRPPSPPRVAPIAWKAESGAHALLGFSLVAFNPGFLATWTAIAAIVSASTHLAPSPAHAPALAIPVALGAFVGILAWFSTLFTVVQRHSTRFSPARLDTAVRVVGVAMLGFGAWLATSSAMGFLRLARAIGLAR